MKLFSCKQDGLNNLDIDSACGLQVPRFWELFVHQVVHDDHKVFAGMVLEHLALTFSSA